MGRYGVRGLLAFTERPWGCAFKTEGPTDPSENSSREAQRAGQRQDAPLLPPPHPRRGPAQASASLAAWLR